MLRVHYQFIPKSASDAQVDSSFQMPGAYAVELADGDQLFALYRGFPFRALLAERDRTANTMGGTWRLRTSDDIVMKGPIRFVRVVVEAGE